MVIVDDPLFPSTNIVARTSAGHVVAPLLASDAANAPIPLPLKAEGGSARGPPQRDKEADKVRFNVGASLHDQDQLKVLAMLNANNDRFAFSMEDLEPAKFTGEPMRLDLNTDKPIFRPPHKLGQVELDFVEAQCSKFEGLGFIKRST